MSYQSATSGVTVSLAISGLQDTGGAGFDQLRNFENLRGSESSDRLTGNDQANVIEGGGGVDILDGGAGIDTASYASASSGVRVSLSTTGFQITGGAGIDQLRNFENLRGSAFADTLAGNSGNNVLDGGLGNDTASYANASSGVTVSLDISGSQNTVGAGFDTLLRIQNLTGSSLNDTLTGDGSTNALNGRAGDDILRGGNSGDILTGGLGADRFVYSAVSDSRVTARDQITDFAAGVDRIDLSLIDANTSLAGNQDFRFIGGITLNPARLNQGELGVQVSGSDLMLVGNTGNSSGTPDFMVKLSGLGANGGLIASDFIL